MTTTIVTAYFKLKQSKSNHNTYLEWMRNMLVIQSPMVIFCDNESFETIKSIRREDVLTKIIIIDFTAFFCYKYYQIFLNDFKKDHENKYHNPDLYLIWNEKSNFLKTAIEMNCFTTDYYLWVDIGCFRKPNTD